MSDKININRDKIYRAYQLDWMLSHGYSLRDYALDEDDEDEDDESILDRLSDEGINGMCFASFDEFLDAEYQDEEYMTQLIERMPDSDSVMELWYKDNGYRVVAWA